MKADKFMRVAQTMASYSKDRSTQVGAVALDDNLNVISTGWNGFPRGVNDDIEERHQRPEKYLWTAHAEENLVAQAAYGGRSLKGSTVLVTALFPCATCARMLIQAGVVRIIAPKVANERWAEQNAVAQTMFNEAGVEVIEHDPVQD